ncbi:TlpA family protein disulfide reductase [Roseivirga thermotolerans]|uniref:TlpA family protein disulfide reductase n=1 Tax=Roseivirga thermotolerans TaxID=1758176 RepID=UPI001679FCB5|nr:TlpA disulfide reductase family protein [Roseivirga thermotolerans]
MNKKAFLLPLLLLIFFTGCDKKPNKNLPEIDLVESPNQAIVIVNNSTESPISIELLDSVAHQSDNWIVTYESIDTISLKLNQPTRAIVHSLVDYRQTKFISNGDTLRIDLDSSELKVKSTDRLNAQKIIEERSQGLLETDSLFNLFISVDSSLAFKGVDHGLSVVKRFGVSVNKPLLESYPEIYDKLVQNLIYELEATPTTLEEIHDPELEAIQSLKYEINRHEAQLRLRYLASQFNRPEIYDKMFDSNLYQTGLFKESPFARDYLSFLINQFVLKGEQLRSGNKSYVNYKKAYDLMPNYLEGELLKYAREICLEQMVSYEEGNLNVRGYLSKFLKEHKDSAFVESFESRFLLAYDKQMNATVDLVLMSNAGTTFSLSDLIQEARDSTLFYLDFWASWCAPCRKAMPYSEEKRALFEDKGVQFIYLSMDRDQQKWRTASLSHGLETYKHSYLLINPEEQQLIKDLGIDFIPRYIILDSQGKVIEPNAPGPEGDLLDKTINSYLKN